MKQQPHKEQSILQQEVTDAKTKVLIGARYSHYKDPQKIYEVMGFGFLESNDELYVIYKATYGDQITFLRPLTSWLDKVEIDGAVVNRFILLR